MRNFNWLLYNDAFMLWIWMVALLVAQEKGGYEQVFELRIFGLGGDRKL